MDGPVAILVVNGGKDPEAGSWLEICLSSVRRHTPAGAARVYAWNNNLGDPRVRPLLASFPGAVLVEADPGETLSHPHAVPLQRLYERARADGAAVIVTLDSDSFPVRDGWLENLLRPLGPRVPLSGVWRDELAPDVLPYVHPCGLAVTVRFVEEAGLRFDGFHSPRRAICDTLAAFTDAVEDRGLEAARLLRSNRNSFHRLMGAVYGGAIYHHGAGSRTNMAFWDEVKESPERRRLMEEDSRLLRDESASLLFRFRDRFAGWLEGRGPGTEGVGRPDFLLVLGMHRSGTSCLTGCLERCGVFLGEVSRANPHNLRGNHEAGDLVALQEGMLRRAGGSWRSPPPPFPPAPEEVASLRAIVERLAARGRAGVKDPRTLLLAEAWEAAAGSCARIGTFRHPAAVARSLERRDGMGTEEALALWNAYNGALLRLHRERPFPLLAFDLSDPSAYVRAVCAAAARLGLDPDPPAVADFVSRELDHGGGADGEVPAACAATWDQLRSRAYRPGDPGEDFDAALAEFRGRCSGRRRALEAAAALPAPPPPGRSLLRRAMGRLKRGLGR